MKAIVQRCRSAQVKVDGEIVGQIGSGLVIFLGIINGDDETHAARLALKIARLRIFDDDDGHFQFSVCDTFNSVLLISNFTVCGDTRKGNRPNFADAASASKANELYERFAKLLLAQSIEVETGIFGADMQVLVENDGPVSIILEAT